jgi:hypothetical protein
MTMSNEPLALSDIWTGPPNEAEYDAVCAALMATERGRWFLTEYARRHRHADTQLLLATLARLEDATRGDVRVSPAAQHTGASEGANEKGSPAEESSEPRMLAAADQTAAPSPIVQSNDSLLPTPELSSGSVPPATSGPPTDRQPAWFMETPDFPQRSAAHAARQAQIERPVHSPLPDPLPLLGPQDDPADLFEPLSGTQQIGNAASRASSAAAQAKTRMPSVDPLAAIRGLSEEDLIALFS